MEIYNINNIADHPLAGCLEIIEEPGNYSTLKEHLQSKLALCTSIHLSQIILKQIEQEAPVSPPEHEYVVNELQYEIRKSLVFGVPKLTPAEYDQKESGIIKSWCLKLEERFCSDDILDFVSLLVRSRACRIRQ